MANYPQASMRNVFNYVLRSMELLMSEESKATKYYGQFHKLAGSLLDVRLLDDKD
jgi:hypothetical protein